MSVTLKCIKEGSKLRVRIVTQGYYNEANCQFPRDLREEGRQFTVPAHAVSLITSRGKWFYSVKNKSLITVNSEEVLTSLKVYEDTETVECAICYDQPKCMVLIPCGHYHTCATCTGKIMTCPICRVTITKSINKALMED